MSPRYAQINTNAAITTWRSAASRLEPVRLRDLVGPRQLGVPQGRVARRPLLSLEVHVRDAEPLEVADDVRAGLDRPVHRSDVALQVVDASRVVTAAVDQRVVVRAAVLRDDDR